jgi:hypothetical protein
MMTKMDQEYFERMLEAQFKSIEGKMDHVIKLQEIANHRTTKNEDAINDINKWRAESRGHWKAVTAIGSMIGAFLGFLIALWLR